MQQVIDAQSSDLFDVLAYVAFALEPQTRAARADRVRVGVHDAFTDKQSAFVSFVLDQYVMQDVAELDTDKLTPLLRLPYNNAIADDVTDLDGAKQIRKLFVWLQKFLYTALFV